MSTTHLQHAWYELTRGQSYASLALVPVEDAGSTLMLAHELAKLAARDPRQRVLIINATGRPSPRLPSNKDEPLIGGREMFAADGIVPVQGGRFGLLDCARLGIDEATVGMVDVPRYIDQVRAKESPFTLILVATGAPLQRAGSVPAARAADAVVLCVSLGETTLADARRTIELCGEDNVAGSIAFRPRAA